MADLVAALEWLPLPFIGLDVLVELERLVAVMVPDLVAELDWEPPDLLPLLPEMPPRGLPLALPPPELPPRGLALELPLPELPPPGLPPRGVVPWDDPEEVSTVPSSHEIDPSSI